MSEESNITKPFVLVDKRTGEERYVGTDTTFISWDDNIYKKRSCPPSEKSWKINKIINNCG